MRCEYPNRDNVMDGVCGATATWMVQLGVEGYPGRTAIPGPIVPHCGMHAIAVAAGVIADPLRHKASVQCVRIENAHDILEGRRRIGS